MVNELLDALEQDFKIRGKWSTGLASHLKPIKSAFGTLRATEVKETVIDRVISNWIAEKRSPGTINQEIQLLGQAFKLGMKQKRTSFSPNIRRLPHDNRRQGFFERKEFNKVLAHLPDDLKDFCLFAFLTAWRKGEVASLADGELGQFRKITEKRQEAYFLNV